MRTRCSGALLVEVLVGERFSESKAAPFPFVAGYLSARGIPCQWLSLAHSPGLAGGDALLFDPDAGTRRAILAAVREAGLESRLFDTFEILLAAAKAHEGPPTTAALLDGFAARLRGAVPGAAGARMRRQE